MSVAISPNINPKIVPRKAPDFNFDDSIPKYWFAGDPFKTRFFDAMSTMFPEGEKYFIQSVRAYSEQITDVDLRQAVRDFTYQEAQHSLAHGLFNDRLRLQGIDVDKFEATMRTYFKFIQRFLPRSVNIANTAAAEHLTAIISHIWTQDDIQRDSDPKMRALLYWHGVEEIEHKAVAFDVMQQVAKVGYMTRVLSLAYESITFPISIHLYMNEMFKVDGFSAWQRTQILAKGLHWLYGRQGLLATLLPSYLSYYHPKFHPWQEGQMETYHAWRNIYEKTGNVIDAGTLAAKTT